MPESDQIIYEAAHAVRKARFALEELAEALEGLVEAQGKADEEGDD